jgi:two-component system, chemotaxis family, chemotaxis protein CheY
LLAAVAELGVSETENDDVIARSKILIVDEEYHARKTIRALLHAMGCTRIHEAHDGASGLEAVYNFLPDVVLLHWEIPDMGGAEFVRRLRSQLGCRCSHAPIVMLSGQGERARVLDAVRHGVHEFLLKPVSRAALKARLHSALASSSDVMREKPAEPRKLAS